MAWTATRREGDELDDNHRTLDRATTVQNRKCGKRNSEKTRPVSARSYERPGSVVTTSSFSRWTRQYAARCQETICLDCSWIWREACPKQGSTSIIGVWWRIAARIRVLRKDCYS